MNQPRRGRRWKRRERRAWPVKISGAISEKFIKRMAEKGVRVVRIN